MSSYFIANIKLTNESIYKVYLEKCDEIFRKYNGEYLIVDSNPEILEGKWLYSKIVVIKFTSKAMLMEWYNSKDYQEILKYRIEGAQCDTIIAEGK
jgi:uncharacterized protein (DUF1330 family)